MGNVVLHVSYADECHCNTREAHTEQLFVRLTEETTSMISICPGRLYRQGWSSCDNPFNIWLALDYNPFKT